MTDLQTMPMGDHRVPDGVALPPAPPPPLEDVEPVQRRTPAEEARTLVAQNRVGALASLSEDGVPWSSLVAYVTLDDGIPVLCVSTLAEHGRNLQRDQRASLMVSHRVQGPDPLAKGRVTLAGHVERPEGELLETARAAYIDKVPSSSLYAQFDDFSFWVLRVERVRWVGGYGVMDSVDAASYAAAEPDPVGDAGGAVSHLNADHADALLSMARAFTGYTDAESARCTGADRYGLDLMVATPRGTAPTRVGFLEPVQDMDGLRQATIELTRRAEAVLA